jgi:hypothetical protein
MPNGEGAKALVLCWIDRRERHHRARCTDGPCAGSISPTTAWPIAAAKLTLSIKSGASASNPLRDLRRRSGAVAKEHPDVALHLAHRVAADVNAPGHERLARHQL